MRISLYLLSFRPNTTSVKRVAFDMLGSMARPRNTLQPHLTSEQLRERYRRATEAKEARRWHALWLLSQGHSAQETAQTVGLCPAWVRRVGQRYNAQGPQTVPDGHRRKPGGRSPRLTEAQQGQLRKVLEKAPAEGGFWSGTKVAGWITKHTGQKTYAQLGCIYLRRLGWTLQVPRRRHAQAATPAQQHAFKKSSGAR